MTGACGVEMNGPLAPFAGGAEEALASEGYSRQRARLLVGLMAEVSEWLGVGGLRVGEMSWEVIDEFLATRGRAARDAGRCGLAADRAGLAGDRKSNPASGACRWPHGRRV